MTGTAPRRVVAVIPAHNERATIARVVQGAAAHVDLVLVIDDGSSDETARHARDAGARVIELRPNRGKGGALVEGMSAACALGATHIVTIDADGEHDPSSIPALLSALGDADIALGWRKVFRSGPRRFVNALALFWFRLLDPAIHDTICGFRAFRADAVPVIQNEAGGFAYEHEVLLRAVLHGLRLAAVPVEIHSRAGSHVTPREMIRANNHFDRWTLAHLGRLPVPGARKALLALGCLAGLAFGVPTLWLIDRRRTTERHA
jgi:glycosyltransferase involved in cell wall biosynthesis